MMTNQHGGNIVRKGMKIMVVAVAAKIYWRWHPPPLPSSLHKSECKSSRIPPPPIHRPSPVGELAEVLLRLGHLLREHVVDLRLSQVLLARHVVDLLHVQILNMSHRLPASSFVS